MCLIVLDSDLGKVDCWDSVLTPGVLGAVIGLGVHCRRRAKRHCEKFQSPQYLVSQEGSYEGQGQDRARSSFKPPKPWEEVLTPGSVSLWLKKERLVCGGPHLLEVTPNH